MARRKRSNRKAVVGQSESKPRFAPWMLLAIGGFIGWMISDAAKIIEFPNQVATAVAQLKSWYSDDEAWTGSWDNFPEGLVNMEEMNLSEEADLGINMKVVGGEISGTISSKAFCGQFQTFHFIRGRVGRNSGEMVMWDIILGIGRDLATFGVELDNGVLVVKPISGDIGGLPALSRLGKFPGVFDENAVADYGDCGKVKKLGPLFRPQSPAGDR